MTEAESLSSAGALHTEEEERAQVRRLDAACAPAAHRSSPNLAPLTFPPGPHPAPPQLCLHPLAFGLQQLDVPPALAHLQPEHRAAVIHAPVYLRHSSLGQDLHDGQQLVLEAAVLRHTGAVLHPPQKKQKNA